MPYSENGTNSAETPNKSKAKLRGKKRKRIESESSSDTEDVLPDNVLEVENNITASAVKNNLDDTSVKKILKKVVTNDHVLALVKLQEEESERENNGLQPKLTRAKAKELKKVSSTTWNLENLELTPINHIPVKTRPEVKALIAQELPEDEDDEEYQPTNDDVPSDEDMESCSDLDSQPRTPATPRSQKTSPRVVKDGPFKVPQDISTPARRKLDMQEEATIALRTRSKLCLSETPIEHIESSFVPPDDVPVPPGEDHLWNEFLSEYFNPASASKNEDDDEADPEYSVAADPDAHDEDEDLESSIVKISKKELSDLMTELFNVMPEATVEAELTDMANTVLPEPHTHIEPNSTWEGKQEPHSDEETQARPRFIFERRSSCISIGKTEPDDLDCDEVENVPQNMSPQSDGKGAEMKKAGGKKRSTVVEIRVKNRMLGVTPTPPKYEQPELLKHIEDGPVQVVLRDDIAIQPEQIQILQQQLRQHIQLSASNFLQLCVHPLHWTYAPTYKEYLESLLNIGTDNPSSVVNVCNLQPAVELIHSWEQTMSERTPENEEMVKFIQEQAARWRRRAAHHNYYVGDFHEIFMRVVANSPVFLYPHLLPAMPYRPDVVGKRFSYLHSEDELIALGLEQFWKYVEDNPELFRKRARAVAGDAHRGLVAAAELVVKHMMPWSSSRLLLMHVHCVRRRTRADGPLARFLRTRKVEPVKHKILPFNPTITLYQQPEHEVPKQWVRFLAQSSKRFKEYLNSRPKGMEPTRGVDVNFLSANSLPIKDPLPIGFIEEVPSLPVDWSPPRPQSEPQDVYDVHIDKTPVLPVHMFRIVETSTGTTLVPVSVYTTTLNAIYATPSPVIETTSVSSINSCSAATNMVTVTCNNTPINSTMEHKSPEHRAKPIQNCDNFKTKNDVATHCKCCILLRRICRIRQTTITEYFSRKPRRAKCHCSHISYPRITNRLRLLVKRSQSSMRCAYSSIQNLLESIDNGDEKAMERLKYSIADETNDEAFVAAFQTRLSLRLTIARNPLTRKRVNSLLGDFDTDTGDPVVLVKELEQLLDVDIPDMSEEVVGLLSPEQAEKVGKYRDYFMQNCLDRFLRKMEEQIQNTEHRRDVARLLNSFLCGPKWAACTMCSELLISVGAYPQLAAYTFTLFPHCSRNLSMRTPECKRKAPLDGVETEPAIDEEPIDDKHDEAEQAIDEEPIDDKHDEAEQAIDEEPIDDKYDEAEQATIDYETDHSSRSSECSQKAPLGNVETEPAIDEKSLDDKHDEAEQPTIDQEADHSSKPPACSEKAPLDGVETGPAIDDKHDEAEQATVDYEAGHSSSGEDDESERIRDTEHQSDVEPDKETEMDTEDVADTQEQECNDEVEENDSESSNTSLVIVFEEESIKEEPIEWKRDEDKLILETLQQHLTPKERLDKTILELIDEKEIVQILANRLTEKSENDVRERVLYILRMLAVSEMT